MWDIFSFSFWADFWQTHGLWLMFFSAFLSATILPGNSEIVFVSLAAPKVLVGSPLTGLVDGFRKLTAKMTALYGR